MIRSSLDSLNVSISKNIDSKYDTILEVSKHLDEIEEVAAVDLATIVTELESLDAAIVSVEGYRDEATASALTTTADRAQTALDVLSAEDSNLEALSRSSEAEDVVTKTYSNGVPSDTTEYSAKHYQAKAEANMQQTISDAAQVALDLAATNQDTIDTAADVLTTNQDATNTAADRVQTGLDVISSGTSAATATTQAGISTNSAGYSQEWAITAEDTLVSASAGGNEMDDYSALHHAKKAKLEATSATASATTATTQAGIATDAADAANADATQTALDRVATGNDVDSTNSNAAATAADLVATNQDTIDTAADRAATNADMLATNDYKDQALAALQSTADIFDTFDDRFLGVKTEDPTLDNDGDALVAGTIYYNSSTQEVKFYNGAAWDAPDTAAATSAQNASDSAAAALVSQELADADAAQTALDRVATGNDVVSTNADVVTTNNNTTATAADVVTTGNNVTTSTVQADISVDNAGYSQEWAVTSENTLISVEAGGNGTTDYSALHHAAKAKASEINASSSATIASTKADETSLIADNLHTLTVDTGIAGSDVEYDNTNNILTVPRGSAGVNGVDGMTPVYAFTMDGTELVIDLVEHIPSTQTTEGEW